MKRLVLVVLLFASGCRSLSPPAGEPVASAPLDPADVARIISVLPPAPVPGSPRNQADQAQFLEQRRLQDTRRWAQATADLQLTGPTAFSGFSCAVGAAIGPNSTPKTFMLLESLARQAEGVYEPAKLRFPRARPFVGNGLPICTERSERLSHSNSYPSGHAMVGWSAALVLSELAPARQRQILARGYDFGESRLVCGVHYGSDVEAGRLLASAMVARLHADPGFRRLMRAARSELAAARPYGACAPNE